MKLDVQAAAQAGHGPHKEAARRYIEVFLQNPILKALDCVVEGVALAAELFEVKRLADLSKSKRVGLSTNLVIRSQRLQAVILEKKVDC